jgi:uncharacterized protein
MTQLTCPTCRRLFDTEQTDAMPFCSQRCRLIDLHRWLNETNSLPADCEEGGEEPPTPEA